MKEFIDKLIERLEEYCKPDCNGCCSHCHFSSALGIVNELAEEYKDNSIVILTDREREVLSSNLSAEIMKMQFHYGNNVPERLQVLYSLRDKLCHKEDKK